MLQNNMQLSKQESVKSGIGHDGFTIIEVLIVLAIAGLILLIVFLAVPALQRNSRNTSYRNEASRILAAAQEHVNNSGGTPPILANNCVGTGGASTNCDANPPTNDAMKIWQLAKVKGIDTIFIRNSWATVGMSPGFNMVRLQSDAKCGSPNEAGNAYGVDLNDVSSKSLVLVYAIENADGSVKAQCIDA